MGPVPCVASVRVTGGILVSGGHIEGDIVLRHTDAASGDIFKVTQLRCLLRVELHAQLVAGGSSKIPYGAPRAAARGRTILRHQAATLHRITWDALRDNSIDRSTSNHSTPALELQPGAEVRTAFHMPLPPFLPASFPLMPQAEGHGVTWQLVAQAKVRLSSKRHNGSAPAGILGGASIMRAVRGIVPTSIASDPLPLSVGARPAASPVSLVWPSVRCDDTVPFFGKGPVLVDVTAPDRILLDTSSLPVCIRVHAPLLRSRGGHAGKLRATVRLKLWRHVHVSKTARAVKVHPCELPHVPLSETPDPSVYQCQATLQLPNNPTLVTLPPTKLVRMEASITVDIFYGHRKLARAYSPVTIDWPPAGTAAGNYGSAGPGAAPPVAMPVMYPPPLGNDMISGGESGESGESRGSRDSGDSVSAPPAARSTNSAPAPQSDDRPPPYQMDRPQSDFVVSSTIQRGKGDVGKLPSGE